MKVRALGFPHLPNWITSNLDNFSKIGFLLVFCRKKDYFLAVIEIVAFIVAQHESLTTKVRTLGFLHLPKQITLNLENFLRMGILLVFPSVKGYLLAIIEIVSFIVDQHGSSATKVGTLGFLHLPNQITLNLENFLRIGIFPSVSQHERLLACND